MFQIRSLLALTAIALAAFSAPAQNSTPVKGGKSSSPFATQITEMRAVRALLQQADHDYQGHRAAAVHQITLAIHALQPPHPNSGQHKNGANKSAGNHSGQQGTPKEPQALSDTQLQQAINQLSTIQTQLAGVGGTGPSAAATALQSAVKELKVALTIK